MAHRLILCTAGCPLCQSFQREIEGGKCGPCQLEEIDVRDPRSNAAMQRHGVRVVPTLVIDGRVKVEGALDIPRVCDNDFYAKLESQYAITNARLLG